MIRYEECWREKTIQDRAEKEILKAWIKPGIRCLELGGGYGRITSLLEENFHQVCMIDLSLRQLNMAYDTLRLANIVRGNILKLPFKSGLFDTIVMIRVAQHIKHPSDVMGEILRVGKSGSRVVLSVPNPWINKVIHFPSTLKRGLTETPSVKDTFLNHPSLYLVSGVKLLDLKGVGLFDNFFGKFVGRYHDLSNIDIQTSSMWFFKSDLFMLLEIDKSYSKEAC